jgi:hypothetical protein
VAVVIAATVLEPEHKAESEAGVDPIECEAA